MNRIHISHTRYPDGVVSGLDATGLTESQLRHYALEAGFGLIGDPDSSTVYMGSRRHIERLFFILEMSGYDVAADAYEIKKPFARYSSHDLTQMIVGLMDDADGTIWKARAEAMLSGMLRALVWLRDTRGDELDVSVIRHRLRLDSLVSLAEDSGLPTSIEKAIWTYLSSLPPDREQRIAQHDRTALQIAELLDGFSSEEDAA